MYVFICTNIYVNTSCQVCLGCLYVYDFKAVQSALDNQKEGLHLGEANSSFPSSHLLPIVVCLRVGNFPFSISTFIDIDIVSVLFMQPFLGKTVLQQESPVIIGSNNLSTSFHRYRSCGVAFGLDVSAGFGLVSIY